MRQCLKQRECLFKVTFLLPLPSSMLKIPTINNYKYGSFSLQVFVINLKPSTHHLPRLALLFAGGVIFVYLM